MGEKQEVNKTEVWSGWGMEKTWDTLDETECLIEGSLDISNWKE